MFEKELAERLKKIFGLEKATYAEPGESQEQGTLFIQIETSRNQIAPPIQRARVTGKLTVFGPGEKVPFGFFSKGIAAALPELKSPLYFFDFEENTQRYQNIVQRSVSFVYFFTGQYDPDIGTLSEVEFIEEP